MNIEKGFFNDSMNDNKEYSPKDPDEIVPESSVPSHLLRPVPPTLLLNMERVVELARVLSYGESLYHYAEPYLQYLMDRMNLSRDQSLLLSLFMESGIQNEIYMSTFAQILQCTNLRMYSFSSDADVLVKRKLIKRIVEPNRLFYKIPRPVVQAFKKNEVYDPTAESNLTIDKFFDNMEELFESDEKGDELLGSLDALSNSNSHLEFVRAFKAMDCGDDMRKILYVLCNLYVNEGDEMVAEYNWEFFFDSPCKRRRINSSMKNQDNELFAKKIVENANSDGMVDSRFFRLTDNAKEKLFKELNIAAKQARPERDLLKSDTFPHKQLFYNPAESSQIDELSELLMPERFAAVQERLEQNGMRKGFACLFYGSPGTGKTETVYQLARRTGRDLMVIDVSQIKSCWVGESEKNIKGAFNLYREYVKRCETMPILLFNEADAVLGIRQEGAQKAVDKMENSIQNIILQEMEQLEGIMIATTNLTQNLDKAFERRFIYKIEFKRPSLEAKCAIWHSMIPALSDSLVNSLAEDFNFSGGQIENIARKYSVEMILRGTAPSDDKIRQMCRAESLSGDSDNRQRIGFRAS